MPPKPVVILSCGEGQADPAWNLGLVSSLRTATPHTHHCCILRGFRTHILHVGVAVLVRGGKTNKESHGTF